MGIDFQAVKSAVSLIDVCEHYDNVKFTKRDHEKAWSCCPFHNEKNPSFAVNFAGEYAGRFHCFGCNVSGDVIDFVEKMECCTKPEAALMICEKHAPHLLTDDGGKFKRQLSKARKSAQEERDELVDAAREACRVIGLSDKKKADELGSVLDAGTYTENELYSLLNNNGAKATAESIERKFHPESFEDEPKRERGRPKKARLSLVALESWLSDHGITIRYNVLTKSIFTTGLEGSGILPELLEESSPVYLHDTLCEEGFSCTRDHVQSLLGLIAARNTFNPVLSLLDESPDWDGVDRLETVYRAFHLSEYDALSRSLMKKWFCQCLALQFNSSEEPFGAEGVLILNGPQGVGKTTSIKKLAFHDTRDGYLKTVFREGRGAFKEGLTLSDDRDSIAVATSAWIAELGEISGTMKKSDENFLKNFVSRDSDEYRVPYGKTYQKCPRRTSFYGTVNDAEFLADTTGSRRWWVVPVTQKIDLDALDKIDKIQFWKQIETYVRTDLQCFRLSPEDRELSDERNVEYTKNLPAVDEILDIIAAADANPSECRWIPTTTVIFKEAYPSLSRYSAKVISNAIDEVIKIDKRVERKPNISKDQVTEFGFSRRTGKFIILPMLRSNIIYSCPSEIPPEDRVKPKPEEGNNG